MLTRRLRALLRMIMNGSGGKEVMEREWNWCRGTPPPVPGPPGDCIICILIPAISRCCRSSSSSSSSRSVSLPDSNPPALRQMSPRWCCPPPAAVRFIAALDMLGVLTVTLLLASCSCCCCCDGFWRWRSDRCDRRLQDRQPPGCWSAILPVPVGVVAGGVIGVTGAVFGNGTKFVDVILPLLLAALLTPPPFRKKELVFYLFKKR